MWFTLIDAFLITFVPYGIMIVCYIKIINHFKYNQYCLSAASRRIQKDLNKVLLAQAIIPIFSAFLPMGIHIFSGLINVDLIFLNFIAGSLFSWIPVGNAFSVLFFITAYKERLQQLFIHMKPVLPQFQSNIITVKV